MARQSSRAKVLPILRHSPTERGDIMDHLARYAEASGVELKVSSLPETRGVDFLWQVGGTLYGVQRKRIDDLVASLGDGRLELEVRQMKSAVTMPMLVVEGRPRWVGTTDITGGSAQVQGRGRTHTWAAIQGVLVTVQASGIGVVQVRDARQCGQWILMFHRWTTRSHHQLGSRPRPVDDWGEVTNADWQVHLLRALPGVGEKTARAIIDTMGRCPLRVDATEQELMEVPGVGRVTARRIIHSVNGPPGDRDVRVAKKGKGK